jgi:serine/threonine-protein kinase
LTHWNDFSDPRARLESGLAAAYTIERELGRGGMATVYLAHDLKHDRPVALKVLHSELATVLGPERFKREIKLAARLQHPHILTVLDSGTAGGLLWFTMPFVRGESLRSRLDREVRLPLQDALRITREAAQALEYAHGEGVVHRDIKPENILLTEDGTTLVADFGIARPMGERVQGQPQLTDTGVSIGTPAYMAPEQAMGESAVDGRADEYSLAVVCYEMLAGEAPYSGPTAAALMAAALTRPVPSVRTKRPEVTEAADRALQRALAHRPEARLGSVAEFAAALSGSATTSRPADSGLHIRRPLFTILGLGIVIGAGVLFAWTRSHGGEGVEGGSARLAVLPFENQGPAEQNYFADGMTDAVRGKLTTLSGLRITASTSAEQYRKTSKSVAQIGKELGVAYVLMGTVRWAKSASGVNRVQVSPSLVEAATGTLKWQAPFDAALTDVFKVQSEIAERVAQELNVALGDSTRRELAAAPTQSLAAYDAYLRGNAAGADNTPPTLRRAVAAYAEAVALDTTFALAWAHLASAHARLYYITGAASADAAAARAAAQRALALAPRHPEAHVAMGAYQFFVLGDNLRALAEDSIALSLAPGDARYLREVAGDEQGLGRYEAARVHLEQSARLDPRSARAAAGLGYVLLFLRRYAEARPALERGVALAPTNLDLRRAEAQAYLAEGDLAGARRVLRAAPKEVQPTALVAFFAGSSAAWVLDDEQEALLLRLRPSAFDGLLSSWGLALAGTYWRQGKRAQARIYADSARVALEAQVRASPEKSGAHGDLGLALAYLGRKAEAIREGERGAELNPLTKDANRGPSTQLRLATIYTIVEEPEKAIDRLEALLKVPYFISRGWLRIDPTFASLRGNPRFGRLVAGN